MPALRSNAAGRVSGSGVAGRRASRRRLPSRNRTRVENRGAPAQPLFQFLRDFQRSRCAQSALPYHRDAPASLEQVVAVAPVPFGVLIELGLPELFASSRRGRVPATGVAVPEAAVHKTYGTKLAENDVRCAGESPVVQAIPKSAGVDGSAQIEFRPRVPASDPGHHARSGCTVHYVCHRGSRTDPRGVLRGQQTTRDVRKMIRPDELLRRGSEAGDRVGVAWCECHP